MEQNQDSSMLRWARNEVELAIKTEKEASGVSDEWGYGVECYKSAMRAFQSLLNDNHSGMSIQITKSILNRLIDGKCLTPIEDTNDAWNEITWSEGGCKEFQCTRMSSLFKKVDTDGTVTYSDVNRVQCVEIDDPHIAYNSGFATRLVDKIFPIEMPYLPAARPFKVFRETFLVDPKHGDYDHEAYFYILLPDGQKVELNRYFKEDDSGKTVPIDKVEYEEAKKTAKKK